MTHLLVLTKLNRADPPDHDGHHGGHLVLDAGGKLHSELRLQRLKHSLMRGTGCKNAAQLPTLRSKPELSAFQEMTGMPMYPASCRKYCEAAVVRP